MLTRVLLVLAFLLVGPASAQVDFTSTIAFGDSLTDNVPFQPLAGADPVEILFSQANASNANLFVKAISGSTATDVNFQIISYALDLQNAVIAPPGTLFSYEIGTNDLITNEMTFKVAPPPSNPAGMAIFNQVIAEIANQLDALDQFHPGAKFIVWTVPDVTTMPGGLTAWNAAERANMRAWVDLLNASIRPLATLPHVLVYDFEFGLSALVQNPPTLGTTTLINTPAFGTLQHIFADAVHPTAVTNGILANWLIANVNQKWGTSIPMLTVAQLQALCGC